MAVDDGYISDSDPISKSVKVFRLLCLPSDGSDDDTDSVPRRVSIPLKDRMVKANVSLRTAIR